MDIFSYIMIIAVVLIINLAIVNIKGSLMMSLMNFRLPTLLNMGLYLHCLFAYGP